MHDKYRWLANDEFFFKSGYVNLVPWFLGKLVQKTAESYKAAAKCLLNYYV